MSRRAAGQLSLLEWRPPETTVRFTDERTRAATLDGRICKAANAALSDCGLSHEEAAQRMACFLGERVSKSMLDAYLSPAREGHRISVTRFVALLHVTRDRRLMELMAEMFGWAVVERKHLPLIELAAVQEKTAELRRQADVLRRQAMAGGAL